MPKSNDPRKQKQYKPPKSDHVACEIRQSIYGTILKFFDVRTMEVKKEMQHRCILGCYLNDHREWIVVWDDGILNQTG